MRVAALRTIHVAMFVSALTTAAWASNGAFVTVQSLTADLESRNIDRIDKSLNEIKRMSHKGEILPFIIDLWEQKREKHPGLPWDVINVNVVKVGIADILLQAEKNGKVKMDPKPMHQFVLGQIDSNDPDVVRKAIGALSLIDDPADVGKLKQVAMKKDPATFSIAVASLTLMCNETAKNAVTDIESATSEPDLKAYVEKRKRESEEFKKKTTWCSR